SSAFSRPVPAREPLSVTMTVSPIWRSSSAAGDIVASTVTSARITSTVLWHIVTSVRLPPPQPQLPRAYHTAIVVVNGEQYRAQPPVPTSHRRAVVSSAAQRQRSLEGAAPRRRGGGGGKCPHSPVRPHPINWWFGDGTAVRSLRTRPIHLAANGLRAH